MLCLKCDLCLLHPFWTLNDEKRRHKHFRTDTLFEPAKQFLHYKPQQKTSVKVNTITWAGLDPPHICGTQLIFIETDSVKEKDDLKNISVLITILFILRFDLRELSAPEKHWLSVTNCKKNMFSY